jgi:hypothetical protein
MIFTFDEWITDEVMAYPTLGTQVGNIPLINDIIKTKVPDVVFGCKPNTDPRYVNLQPYLCYFDEDGLLIFNDDTIVIGMFKESIPTLPLEDQVIIEKRYEKK